MKKTIEIGAIDPVEIYGTGNRLFEALCSYFPELKAVARGNEILLDGSEEDTAAFEEKLKALIERRSHKMSLTPYDVEELFDGDDSFDRYRLRGDAIIVYGTDGKPIKARNRTQEAMVSAYFENDLVFSVGPAGTGKTFVSVIWALSEVLSGRKSKLLLTRPVVEAGESLGFLPGDLQQKLNPYLRPLYDAMEYVLTPSQIKRLEESGAVEIAPLAYMRGRSVNNAVMILDEAQNATKSQMRMFLTRLGENSQAIATGDPSQIDLPHRSDSGLIEAIETLDGIHGVSVIRFSHNDTVRSRIVREIVKAYTDKGRREGDEQSGF